MLKGIGVSTGIGVAQTVLWQSAVAYDYIPRKCAHPAQEVERFEAARRALLDKTTHLRHKAARIIGDGEAAIFDAHNMILADDSLLDPIRNKILLDHSSAEYAVTTQFDELARQFMQLDNDYMRQRVDDILSLRDQMMRELMGQNPATPSRLNHPSIIVAHSLSPADIASLDLSRLHGIICETGSAFGHTAIIARTLCIPAVVGLTGILQRVQNGENIALDGDSGEVWIEPDADEVLMLRRRIDMLATRRAEEQKFRGAYTVSADGRRVELAANVGQLSEVDTALAADAEALGMFRTEMLHISSPSGLAGEEEQFEIYRVMLEKLNGKAATVRTFDDGGNTPSLSIKHKEENNPMMGYRGIRMSLGRPSFFRTQLRALLRASAYGSLRVMFPMISTMEELNDALHALDSIKAELRREGIPFDEHMPVGIYIEVPSAALMSEAFAKRVDFFTIGINNLLQFTLGVDRSNPDLEYLYHQFHPSLLRLVRTVVEAAHQQGISCTMSGEAIGQERVLPLLFGIGLDGFSLNPSLILRSRQILSRCHFDDCHKLADRVLSMQTAVEVLQCITEFELPPE